MNIGIIGDGQLGRMMALAGIPLGLNFGFLGKKNSPSSNLGEVFDTLEALERFSDVVTFESENTKVEWVENLKKPIYPSEKALFIAQHRGREKALFNKLNIPCAPYQVIHSRTDLNHAAINIGLPAILKTTMEGYDGKGQFLIRNEHQIDEAWESMQGMESIFEGFVDFKRELSLIAVRDKSNHHKYYPLTENAHHNSILRCTTAPAQNVSLSLQQTAEKYMQTLLNELDYVGVLTIELFETNKGLVINEIAPRVHNSGHWSIEGSYCSQFENHIRAIAGLPLGNTTPAHSFCAMINIIGQLGDIDTVLKIPNAHLHLYRKLERENRKLGHINVTANSQTELNESIAKLKNFLP